MIENVVEGDDVDAWCFGVVVIQILFAEYLFVCL